MDESSLPLFQTYPELHGRIPYEPVAILPTPARKLAALSAQMEHDLWLKDDGPSGRLYGGNKVRKLGFLLGAAKRDGAQTVLTFGAAGSNHALATAIYAREMGLRPISMMVPQPPTKSVKKNLLRGLVAGAELHHYRGLNQVAAGTCWQFAATSAREGKFPRVIPTGGSSPVGILGFVNAVFELKQQIDSGLLPEPAAIYVASGSMGSAVGLLLGVRLAGLATRVVAVRVTGERFTNLERGRKLFATTNQLLHENDANVPLVPFPESQFTLRHDFIGEHYALYTEVGMAAVRRLKDTEGLVLEGTYSGKAMACLLADATSGALSGKPALFWNTHNAVDFSGAIANADYHALPAEFHQYFETPVQPLDV